MSNLMKFGIGLLLVVVVIGILAAVAPDEEVGIEDVKRETTQAFEATTQYARQKEQEYLEQVEKEVEELRSRIGTLEERARSEISSEMDELVNELKDREGQALAEVETLKNTTDEAWSGTRASLDRSLEHLRAAYQGALDRFPATDEEKEEVDASVRNASTPPAPAEMEQPQPASPQ